MCAQYDCLKGEIRVLPKLKCEVEKINDNVISYYFNEIEILCACVRNILNSFGVDFQLFMQDFRNQLPHTWGSNIFQENIIVHYVENSIFHRIVAMPSKLYHEKIRIFYKNGIYNSLSEKFMPIWTKNNPLIFPLLNTFAVPGNIEAIRKDLFLRFN